MSETEKDRGMWNDIKPKQYFGLVGAMIAIAAFVQITNFRFIPGPLIVGMPLVAVVIGGRMLWLHRESPNLKPLAVATGASALVAIVLGVSLGTSVGDPIIDESDPGEVSSLYESCAEGDLYDCDQLFMESPSGSAESAFGDNCGGLGHQVDIWCSEKGAQEFGGRVG